jgi:hypothetical protein
VGGEAVVRLPVLGAASVFAFARDRPAKERALELRREGGGAPMALALNAPLDLAYLPAGRYSLLVDGAALRSFVLAEGERLDLGVVDAP